ncbi:MAG: hypothetical protein OEQ53_01035 [Saprospiraceae bacterium]|nr:hypothetical protein [Saprospiraceae bacterium]
MAFVFRNVDGNIVGRAADGSDIFVDVLPSDDGLRGKLLSPSANNFVHCLGDSLLIWIEANGLADVEIRDNDSLILQTAAEEVSFFVPFTQTII